MRVIEPGGTIGFLGGGQLARMMALEARRMGYRIAVLDPDSHGPAAAVADRHVKGKLDDLEAARFLAACSDVLTLDTEHVPSVLLARLEEMVPVRPSSHVLGVVQDRREQRAFLEELDVPQVLHAPVDNEAMLSEAAAVTGYPCVLKSRRSGYDGKGQARVEHEGELESAWRSIGRVPAIMESFVQFEREISVLLARDFAGEIRFHPIAENEHRRHILHTTRVPARVDGDLVRRAEAIGAAIANAFDYVGMMAVELFVTADGGLLVNEIAPRTHNSGHYTFGACATSQFEQHIRAICGLPLGDPALLRPAMMLNVLGDAWQDGPPSWDVVHRHANAKLHLYGKQKPSAGRKMGHVLVLGDPDAEAAAVVETIAAGLGASKHARSA